MKLPTASEMRHLDQTAISDFGIPGIVLMENAGLGSVLMAERELGSCRNTFAVIFVGPGNNGGDGLVIGRHLYQRGCNPVFFFLVNPDSLKGDAATNMQIIRNLRLPFHVIDDTKRVGTIPVLCKQVESRGLPCYAVIDAIFGTGLGREVTGHYADTIDMINNGGIVQNAPVISADIPSGMDADTGKIHGTCVRADYTATYGCAKPGHFLGNSQLAGKLEIIDIGIPPEAVFRADITTELTTRKVFSALTQPLHRVHDSHKGSHGHLLVIAGSTGKTGACLLTARGALRSGCGLVSLCVPEVLNPIFETALPEAMTIPLPNSKGFPSILDHDTIVEALSDKKAVVLGPGIGQHPETAELVLRLYGDLSCPVVLDADALNIIAAHRQTLPTPAGPRVFTPHPGELARLLGKSTQNIQSDRFDAALLGISILSNNNQEIALVLKGAGTLISTRQGSRYINTTGNPGMATGGMGDVLSGIIGGFICQGMPPMDAAVAGVYVHGAAADKLSAERPIGYTASEVADAVPYILKRELC